MKGYKKKLKAKTHRIAKYDKLVRQNKRTKIEPKPIINPDQQNLRTPFLRTNEGWERRKKSINWRKLRHSLGESQNWRCCYCTDEMLIGVEFENHPEQITTEHVVPKHKGGSDDWDNLVAACRFCNNTRGGLDIDPMAYVNMAKNIKQAHKKSVEKARAKHTNPPMLENSQDYTSTKTTIIVDGVGTMTGEIIAVSRPEP